MSEAFLARRNYSDLGAPLRDFTHKGVIKVARGHQKAQEQLKCSLTSDELIAYFDPHKKTVLLVDASLLGLGAVLTQSDLLRQ